MLSVLVRSLGSLTCLAALFLAFTGAAAAAPSNDAFAAALVGAGDLVEGSGNNFGATKESGEPAHGGDPGGASVWFAWTASRSQRVFVQFCADGWEGELAIYRGEAVDALQRVASAHDSPGGGSCGEVRFRATPALTYRVAVDGSSTPSGAEEGNFDFRIVATPLQGSPPNDSFAAAETVKPTTSEWFFGSTEEATREPGEPGHGGGLAGPSVWFRWTAPESARMQIFPCRASFLPTISVYTGSTLATLRSIAAPAPPEPVLSRDCQLGALVGVAFDAVAGTTYSIGVDGVDGSWGSFQLRLHKALIPVADVYPPSTFIRKLLRLRGRGIAIQFGTGGGPPGDTFRCKLDSGPFSPCKSPRKWRHLTPGMHRVAVVATDAAGNRDKTPAVRTFRIGGGR